MAQSIGELDDLVGCMIKRDLTKMTLNIYQTDIITKMRIQRRREITYEFKCPIYTTSGDIT